MKRGVGIALLLFVIIIVGGTAVFVLSHGTASAASSGKIIFVDDDFVDDPANHKFSSLQDAIDHADTNPGDTIAVFAGTYDHIAINKDDLTISGEGAGSVTITDSAAYAVSVFADGVTIQNVTIREGTSAALYTNHDHLTVRYCTMTQGSRQSGNWAAQISGDHAAMYHCTISQAGWGLNIRQAYNCSVRDTSFTDIENKAVVVEHSSAVFIDNITATNVFCGMRVLETDGVRLVNSTFADNKVGLILDEDATDSDIRNCRFTGNAGVGTDFGYGIYLDASWNNTITSCHIQGNDRGIYAEATSHDNLIHHNNFIGNGINAVGHGTNAWNSSIGNYWDGYTGVDTDHNGIGDTPYTLTASTAMDHHPLVAPVQSPPARVWVDDGYTPATPGWAQDHFDTLQAALDVVTPSGGCYVYNGSYQDCTVTKNISLVGAGDARVAGGSDGIYVTADDVYISGFVVTASDAAVKIQNAGQVTVANCSVSQAVFGVYLVNTYGCELYNLSVHHNHKGIFLFDASASTIWGSNIHNNTYFGVEMSHTSLGNTVADCHISHNGNYGVYLVQQSNDNSFYHNTFIDNAAYDTCDNQWGGAYEEALGNYWSMHQGADVLKGAARSMPGRDGYVDSPYTIPGGSGAADAYPLRYPVTDHPRFVWVSSDDFTPGYPGWQHDHFASIQMAVDAVQDEGGCFVYDGGYQENVSLVHPITVTGQTAAGTVVRGNDAPGFAIAGDGITLHNVTVRDCWNDPGIHVTGDNATVSGCVVADSYYGVVVTGNDTRLANTSIHHNAYIGAAWRQAQRPVMRHCSVYGNNKGVVLMQVTDGLFTHVEVHNNSVNGLELAMSDNNTFHHVYCIDNMYGVYADSSAGNLFYFNDFIGNDQHAWDNGDNSWDNGTVGNYWHGFDGGTRIQGTYSTPYMVPGGSNADNHPLVRRAGLPVPSFTINPSPTFTMQTVSFTDTSIDLDGAIVQRYWDFDDGSNATTVDATTTHVYGDDGVYTVTLTVTDDDGHTGTATKTTTVFNTAPTAAMTWEPLEPTDMDTILFNGSGSTDPDGYIANYTWHFGDNGTGYGENVSHRYMDNGTYKVTLTVTDDDGATDTIHIDVPVGNVPPLVSFGVSPEEPSTADSIVFTDTSTDPDGTIVNYTWTFGDGTTSHEASPSHSYADNGTYEVTLTARDNDNDTAMASINITVTNAAPGADFTYTPASPTDVDVVDFADTSVDTDGAVVAWQWEFGDGETSTKQNPRHIFPDDGTYQVNLTVTDDDGATSTTSQSIEVYNVPPQARFSFTPDEPTVLDTVTFIDDATDPDGSVVEWEWDFGDGNTSTARDPAHSYAHDGLYTVNLTVTDDDGATGTTTGSLLVINMPPIVNYSYTPAEPTDIQDISFTGNATDPDGTIVNYTWTYGDGNTSYGVNATHRYADNGTYTATLTVTDNQDGKTSRSYDINVSNVPPSASFTYEPDDPKTGKYTTFRDTSTDPDGTIVNATWYYGDGTSDQDGDLLNHKYDSEGDYQVRLVVTDNDGATSNTTRIIEVRDEDEAAGFEFVVLVAAIGILLFMWKRRMGVWRRR